MAESTTLTTAKTAAATRRPCTSCGASWSAETFYANCPECKVCKRSRSRRNRAFDARKIAIAERVIDALAELAEQGWRPDHRPVAEGRESA